MTPEEWERIGQVYELVKHEGDERCESAFADLIRIHNALQEVVTTEAERRERLRAALTGNARYLRGTDKMLARDYPNFSKGLTEELARLAAALGEEAGT